MVATLYKCLNMTQYKQHYDDIGDFMKVFSMHNIHLQIHEPSRLDELCVCTILIKWDNKKQTAGLCQNNSLSNDLVLCILLSKGGMTTDLQSEQCVVIKTYEALS